VKAYLSKRAAAAVERIDEYWRKHANDPGVFAAEFLEGGFRSSEHNACAHDCPRCGR